MLTVLDSLTGDVSLVYVKLPAPHLGQQARSQHGQKTDHYAPFIWSGVPGSAVPHPSPSLPPSTPPSAPSRSYALSPFRPTPAPVPCSHHPERILSHRRCAVGKECFPITGVLSLWCQNEAVRNEFVEKAVGDSANQPRQQEPRTGERMRAEIALSPQVVLWSFCGRWVMCSFNDLVFEHPDSTVQTNHEKLMRTAYDTYLRQHAEGTGIPLQRLQTGRRNLFLEVRLLPPSDSNTDAPLSLPPSAPWLPFVSSSHP